MKKHLFSAVMFSLLALLPGAGRGQGSSQGAPAIPEGLLEGETKFNLAVFLQGDLRGNFAPCG